MQAQRLSAKKTLTLLNLNHIFGMVFSALLFLLALPPINGAGTPCSTIPGYFACTCKPAGQLYLLNYTGPISASVVSVGTSCGWSTASLAFSADGANVTCTFDNKHVGHGTVAPGCASITWDDKTVWNAGAAPPAPLPPLNVHIAPHSHDDVGWDATYLEYFNGCHPPGVNYANVSQELSTVVAGLLEDPKRRFSFVEQAYFQLWFEGQTPALQAQVQMLVAQKRLVFLNGGWSMPDEANPTYLDLLDNVALGHRYIVENFGVSALPKLNWQIDPFGVSGIVAAAGELTLPCLPHPFSHLQLASSHPRLPHFPPCHPLPPLPLSTLPSMASCPPPWVATLASCGPARTPA